MAALFLISLIRLTCRSPTNIISASAPLQYHAPMPDLLPTPLSNSPLLASDAIARTLTSLVQINSVNLAHGGPAGGEQAVMDWAAQFLREHGLDPQIKITPSGEPLLRASLSGANSGPPLIFETHVATVSVEGMTIAPFAGTIRDGKLWGRGATDAKGQAAAMLHAFAVWGDAAEN